MRWCFARDCFYFPALRWFFLAVFVFLLILLLPCVMMYMPLIVRYKENLMKYESELLKGTTKNLILAVLSGGELYGYQIVKAIREQSGEELEFGEGSVYPALHALERDEYLSSHWVPQDGSPDRKYYTLTPKGKLVLKAALLEWKSFSGAVGKVFENVALLVRAG